jgi:uncharacterized surface protein with fasciclin (FAS1) repeats
MDAEPKAAPNVDSGRPRRRVATAPRLRLEDVMSLKHLLNAGAAAGFVVGLSTPGLAHARAEAAPAGPPREASAGGTLIADAAPSPQAEGAAWAVREAAPMAQAPAAQASAPRVVPHGDIVETLRASGQFATFLRAADAANLTAVLETRQNLTVFAPTDAAFAALPPGELERLMADREQLQKLLAHHIVNARVESVKIRGAKGPVPSTAGDAITLDGAGQALKADQGAIVQADVMASNGVIQVVDHVLSSGAANASAAGALKR